MNLHPYLTPDLVALIKTAEPKDIATRLEYTPCDKDVEKRRLGFRVDAVRSGGRRLGLNLPVRYEGFTFSGGYKGLKRRVNIKDGDEWRKAFISRFNEVLCDCENLFVCKNAEAEAAQGRRQRVSARKAMVLPLLGDLPLNTSWYCEDRASITEKMLIETNGFTPEQIQQIADLVRSFTIPSKDATPAPIDT